MVKPGLIAQFVLLLVGAMALAFLAHTQILSSLGLPPYENLILRSYWVNAILALSIFILIYVFRKKLSNQIGFLFMAGSFIKFGVFFLFFHPIYKQDGDMSKLEFGAFFVPYLTALVLETVFVSRLLKKLEESTSKTSS